MGGIKSCCASVKNDGGGNISGAKIERGRDRLGERGPQKRRSKSEDGRDTAREENQSNAASLLRSSSVGILDSDRKKGQGAQDQLNNAGQAPEVLAPSD